jgi:uncharacterized protein
MNIKGLGLGLTIASMMSLALVGYATSHTQNKASKLSSSLAISTTTKSQIKRHGFQRHDRQGKASDHNFVYSNSTSISPDQSPKFVVDAIYQGVQKIHNYQGTPKLKWGINAGVMGGCGEVEGAQYCEVDNTISLTNEDVRLAYKSGDAALAYIIGHEYAHAMQKEFGFQPETTPIGELQADCLAGLYLGTIPDVSFDRQDIAEIRNLAYQLGDNALTHPDHHGTPAERLKAVEIGIQGAIDGSGFAACQVLE